MKKLITVGFYLVMCFLFFFIYSYKEVSEILNSSTGNEGILYLYYEEYFKNADSFNFIWSLLSIMFFLLILTMMDVRIMRLFIYLRNKREGKKGYRILKFLSGSWGRPLHVLGAAGLVTFLVALLANIVVVRYGNSRTVELNAVPDSSVVMVPGTNKYLRSYKTEKKENVYFTYRINAALELWKHGKAKHFLVSGDRTGERGYDETVDIKEALVNGGVPTGSITTDTSGLRTHDSMIALRAFCSKVHTREAVLVSQAFQNRRALFMAPFFGIKASGYSAQGSPTWAMAIREFMGKPKVLIDLFLTNVKPKETAAVEFRDRFEITSEYHLRCVISMFLAFIFFIIYIHHYLRKYEVVSFF